MDSYITRIENTCNNTHINFCTSCNPCLSCEHCNNFTIEQFEWRTINRKNNFYGYDSRNGGFSTCMRDDKKVASLQINAVDQNLHIRTRLRKKIELLFSNYDCCDDCCPLKVFFTDGDGEEYFFTSKGGSSTTIDNYLDTTIMIQFGIDLEVCNNTFYAVNGFEVCSTLGSVCGFGTTGCPRIDGKKLINYKGNSCGEIKVTINATNLVDPYFYNLTTGKFYGLEGTFNGEIVIDSLNGVTSNGQRLSPTQRKKGSNLSGINLSYGPNELVLLAQSGEAEYCVEYGNNWI